MKIERSVSWLPKSEMTAEAENFTIESVDQVENDLRLTLQNAKFGTRIMSVWGENLNKLIDKFGDDGTKWKGKVIALKKEIRMSDNKEIVVVV